MRQAECCAFVAFHKGKGKGAPTRKGGGKGNKNDARASGRIPQKEYEKLTKLPQQMPGQPNKRKCLFWNSTKGCNKAPGECQFVHRCMACNQDHRWCKRHM